MYTYIMRLLYFLIFFFRFSCGHKNQVQSHQNIPLLHDDEFEIFLTCSDIYFFAWDVLCAYACAFVSWQNQRRVGYALYTALFTLRVLFFSRKKIVCAKKNRKKTSSENFKYK